MKIKLNFGFLFIISLRVWSQDTTGIAFKDSISEEIVIKPIQADVQSPVTYTNISRTQIHTQNQGRDIPYLLQQAPSIVAQSDAGNGVGYSYFRLRGLDQTRINFHVNGIPVNDPENQGFFTNNFADLASSAQSIQIQRGVGVSGNGNAPIAGSVGVTLVDLAHKPFAHAAAGIGSFATSRLMVEAHSGVQPSGWASYARLSRLQSNGFKRNSQAELYSYTFSIGRVATKSTLRFNAFGGFTNSNMSWKAPSIELVSKDPRYNANTASEKDEFRQMFLQIQYSYFVSSKVTLHNSAYSVMGHAPRFLVHIPGMPYSFANLPDYATSSDTFTFSDMLYNYQLQQQFMGAFQYLEYAHDRGTVVLGMHANHFRSRHIATLDWAERLPVGTAPHHVIHDNTGFKREWSGFAKANYDLLKSLRVFSDIQLRVASFNYSPVDQPILRDSYKVDPMEWWFLNPRLGTSYQPVESTLLYISVGKVSREPTRFDYMLDDKANFDIRQSQLKPETILNTEVGLKYKSKKMMAEVNLYSMEFRNQLTPSGLYNEFGYAITQNVDRSYRRGIEVQYAYQPISWLKLFGNGSLSSNKIRRFTYNHTVLDSMGYNTYSNLEVDYLRTTPLLTPYAMAFSAIQITPMHGVSVQVSHRFISSMYLDNTQTEALKLPSSHCFDAILSADLDKLMRPKAAGVYVLLHLNNLLDRQYFTAGTATNEFRQSSSGLVPSTQKGVFIAPPRSFMLTVGTRF